MTYRVGKMVYKTEKEARKAASRKAARTGKEARIYKGRELYGKVKKKTAKTGKKRGRPVNVSKLQTKKEQLEDKVKKLRQRDKELRAQFGTVSKTRRGVRKSIQDAEKDLKHAKVLLRGMRRL